VSTPELQCTLDVHDGVVWLRLQGALRASGGAALAALVRGRRTAKRAYPIVADLTGLEVADTVGIAALGQVLRRFAQASAVLPPPWTQARTIVHTHLADFHLVEQSDDVDLP
jgi:anti-anti-sigma regulatory factor